MTSNLRPFKNGMIGNPRGRPPLPPQLRAINAMDAREVSRLCAKYLRMSKADGEKALKVKSLPMGEVWILKCIFEGMIQGDPIKFSVFMDRVCGKTQLAEAFEEAEISTEDLVAMLEERFPHLKKAGA